MSICAARRCGSIENAAVIMPGRLAFNFSSAKAYSYTSQLIFFITLVTIGATESAFLKRLHIHLFSPCQIRLMLCECSILSFSPFSLFVCSIKPALVPLKVKLSPSQQSQLRDSM
jgi:hypothetical protein